MPSGPIVIAWLDRPAARRAIRPSIPFGLDTHPAAWHGGSNVPPAALPDGQITDWPVHPHLQKYSPSRFTQIKSISPAVSRPEEGRFAIVTDVERGMRWTRQRWASAGIAGRALARERSNGTLTNGADADGEVVWSWHPLLVSSLRRHVGPTGRGQALIRRRR
jgi:hypothetical protein